MPVPEPLRVVLVGAGCFAREHATAWGAQAEARLVGVVDPDRARAEAMAAEFGAVAHADLDASLGTADLLDIAAPPSAHLAPIERTLAAGLPTICRKPFRGGLKGVRRAAGLARDRGLTMVEGSGGALALDGDGGLTVRAFRSVESYSVPVAIAPGFGGCCVAALQAHIVDHLRRGAPLETAAADYLRTMEAVEAAYLSHREGRRIDLPVTGEPA